MRPAGHVDLFAVCIRSNHGASRVPARRRGRVRRRRDMLARRIRAIVDDLHGKYAKYLVDHYDLIFLGNMSASAAARRRPSGRRSGQDALVAWRHAAFRDRLIQRAEVAGKVVVMVDEAFTSQMCPDCGHLHKG